MTISGPLDTLQRPDWREFFPELQSTADVAAWRGIEMHVGADVVLWREVGGPAINTSPENSAPPRLRKRKPAAISFSPHHYLTIATEIPHASRRKTERILELKHQSVLPVEAREYVSAFHEISNSKTSRLVQSVILKRSLMQQAKAEMRAAGWDCSLIFLRDAQGKPLPLGWEPDGTPFPDRAKRKWFKALALAITTSAAIALLGLGLQNLRLTHQLSSLEAELATRSADHENAKRKIDARRQDIAQLAGLVEGFSKVPRITGLLEILSTKFADGVSLQTLVVEGETLTLEGRAVRPDQLIAILSAVPGLSDVAFLTPTTRQPGESKAAFSIAARLAPRITP